MGDVRKKIAQNLLKYRKQNNLTQSQLAGLLGVGGSAVSNWEHGLNSIDIDTLYKACQIFGVTLNEMYGYEEPGSPALLYSEHERKMIEQYRKLPQMQSAVDVLLGLRPPG